MTFRARRARCRLSSTPHPRPIDQKHRTVSGAGPGPSRRSRRERRTSTRAAFCGGARDGPASGGARREIFYLEWEVFERSRVMVGRLRRGRRDPCLTILAGACMRWPAGAARLARPSCSGSGGRVAARRGGRRSQRRPVLGRRNAFAPQHSRVEFGHRHSAAVASRPRPTPAAPRIPRAAACCACA